MTRLLGSFLAWHVPHVKGPLIAVALQKIPLSANRIRSKNKTTGLPGSLRRLSTSRVAPVIVARPIRALIDEPVQIHVENLRPNQPVTLHSLLKTEKNYFWESFAHYVSNADGVVQVAKDESQGGCYTGCEPMGLIWSLKPAPGTEKGLRVKKMDVTTPYVVQVSVFAGHISERAPDKTALAVTELERWYMATGVRRMDILHNGVVGTLFLPPGPGPFPGMIDLWGASGGKVEFRASLLASHGFATLALVYINHVDLPYPKGYIGVTEQYFEPRCVIGVNGGHFWGMKTKTGYLYEDFIAENDVEQYNENNPLTSKYFLLPLPDEPGRQLEVGKIQCPVLLITGEDDMSFPSTEASLDIEKKMKVAGNSHLLTRISYPGAGHQLEPPFCPVTNLSKFQIPGMKYRVWHTWGGEMKSHAYAEEDSWQKILGFLKQHLVLN